MKLSSFYSTGTYVGRSKPKFEMLRRYRKSDGVKCPWCRQYKDWGRCAVRYEMRDDLVRVWECPDCGGDMRIDNMTDAGFWYEQNQSAAHRTRIDGGSA
jgi:hypothetical protein